MLLRSNGFFTLLAGELLPKTGEGVRSMCSSGAGYLMRKKYRMTEFSDKKIISSWRKNVKPWISAVRDGEIESRRLVTNKAIIENVTGESPESVLDVGCGEGWLVRELSGSGISCMGVDVVPELIEYARHEGDGLFELVSYEDLTFDKLMKKFDVLVSNFSLLGKESVVHLFQQAPLLLNQGGSFIIQTIHPVAGCGKSEYVDGWREGSWEGFSEKFCDPAPWFFRTIETWKALYTENGFALKKVLEPLNPVTNKPASIIFVGTVIS